MVNSIAEQKGHFYTIDEAINFDFETVKALQLKHLNAVRTLNGGAEYFKRAEGCTFIDHEGKKHLDMIGAVGVVSVGNNNETVWAGIKKCFDTKQFMMGAISYHNIAAAFAHNLSLVSPHQKLTKVGTATGGAEAIEGVIKLVKLAVRNKPEKTHLLACEGAFHGKTTGAVSVGGKEKWRAYQHPLMPNVDHVPYGDIEKLESALRTGKYSAFFAEPIQGEGGIIVPPEGYLKKARELCTENDTYLVIDEIQAGCGRTGKFWCCEHEDIVPDCLTFAKGFSGGLIPFAGYNCTEELYNAAYGSIETCFHHTATYQENGLSCAAGLSSLQYILDNNLVSAAAAKGDYMMNVLKDVQSRFPEIIKDVRGKGLMIGIEFQKVPSKLQDASGEYFSDSIADLMVNKHYIEINHTINNPAVFRFLPPLIVTREEMDLALGAFEASVQEIRGEI